MAVRDSYNVPTTLDVKQSNRVVTLWNNAQTGPVTIKLRVLMWYAAAFVFGGFAVMTLYAQASTFVKIGLVAVIAGFTILLTKTDKAGVLMVEKLGLLLKYTRKNRLLKTKTMDDATPFSKLVGFDYNQETGQMVFADKSVCKIFKIVGTGSILLFPQDKAFVLNRVGELHKNLKQGVEITYLTSKRSQNVDKQVSSLVNQRRMHGEVIDPELEQLFDMQYDNLVTKAGGEYRSIHQYMVVRAPGEESFAQAMAVIEEEVQSHKRAIRYMEPLTGEDGISLFKSIYGDK